MNFGVHEEVENEAGVRPSVETNNDDGAGGRSQKVVKVSSVCEELEGEGALRDIEEAGG